MNFNWPQTKYNNLNAWYIIGVRLVLWTPIQILRILLTVLIFIGWGKQTAKEIWNYLT